jgi:hypothetical protein
MLPIIEATHHEYTDKDAPSDRPSIMDTAEQKGGGEISSDLAPHNALRRIDAELEPLIPYLKLAIENQQPVLVLQMWQRTRYAAFPPAFEVDELHPDAIVNCELWSNSVFRIR